MFFANQYFPFKLFKSESLIAKILYPTFVFFKTSKQIKNGNKEGTTLLHQRVRPLWALVKTSSEKITSEISKIIILRGIKLCFK